jgi:hypothetical protein
MPDMALNNMNIINTPQSGVHFGYTFCQAKVLSPILVTRTDSSLLHIILH